VRGDGAVFTPQPFVGVDDTDEALRAFFAFDLSGLADSNITRAELDLGDYALTGTPLNDLGPLRVEEVDWGSTLEASDFEASVAAQLGTIEDEDDLNNTMDVTGQLRSRIDADRNNFQIRLRFETRTDDDGQNDSVNWAGRAARLVVRYYR
jgi:hypothetical protein